MTVAFLDANVIFSAALGGEVFDLIRSLGRSGIVRLVTSEFCVREALESLSRKRPDRLTQVDGVLLDVEVYAVPTLDHAGFTDLVGPADAHVLAAAVAVDATVVVTGDRTHFGRLMDRGDGPIVVRTPRGFLLDGPG